MSGCPFRLAVINDEITQDFEKSCTIVAKDFGLSWIELRGMWSKNITELNAKEVEDARKILEEHRLRVTDIASPLFKTDWPGQPRSRPCKLPARRRPHAGSIPARSFPGGRPAACTALPVWARPCC